MPEQVLVIPAVLASAMAPDRFGMVPIDIENQILAAHSFIGRTEAESNTDFKQVIPYVVVTHGGRYLLTQRTSQQEETRLHNLFSIGQGGHINNLDMAARRPIIAGLQREVAEEFHLSTAMDCAPVGIINDNSNDVGRVHLGLVYLMAVASGDFEVAETGKHIARWATAKTLVEHMGQMENWSKILMSDWLRFDALAHTAKE